jgi:hypothetical protein
MEVSTEQRYDLDLSCKFYLCRSGYLYCTRQRLEVWERNAWFLQQFLSKVASQPLGGRIFQALPSAGTKGTDTQCYIITNAQDAFWLQREDNMNIDFPPMRRDINLEFLPGRCPDSSTEDLDPPLPEVRHRHRAPSNLD